MLNQSFRQELYNHIDKPGKIINIKLALETKVQDQFEMVENKRKI